MAVETQHNPQDFASNKPNQQFMDDNYYRTNSTNGTADMQRMMTNGSISLPPDVFEKLYLQPQNAVKGQLRKTFGNPTPMFVNDMPSFSWAFLMIYV